MSTTNQLRNQAPSKAHLVTFTAQAVKRRSTKLRAYVRTVVAMCCFVVTVFVSAGADLDLAFAKNAAKRVASTMRKVKNSGQFRLLNIYKTLAATRPAVIDSMNHAKQGLASWYGGIFHGRATAMGTTYNMYAMTAAHRTLPLGTWVQVTNEANGKSLVVQVTDRGPYVANRIMDLSYAAAQKLGYANAGTTHIAMKVLGKDYAATTASTDATASQRNPGDLSALTTSAASVVDSTMVAGVPTAFAGVMTRTENVALTTSDISGLFSAIASVTSGSPVAVANMFA